MIIKNIHKNKNKLIIEVDSSNKIKELYFEVNNEYSDFLCDSLYDSFVVSLLPYAIKHGEDITINGYISSKLYYQLKTYLIPLLCKTFNKKNININTKIKENKYKGKGVGASISCGVDSFYTLLNHTNQKDKNYNITHLTFFNAGSNGDYGGDKSRELFKKRVRYVQKFCKENNYKLITVDTNINEFLMMNHEKTHTFRTLGCVLALQKLFSKYYFASGLPFNGSHIDELDTAYYDILNVQCLSNENISFYCSGIEVTRQEKIEYISNFKETYKWLNVCVKDENNCCKCEKCIRTMIALESIGKLEKYNKVFNLKYYYNNKNKILGKALKYNRDRMKSELYNEIIKAYKKNKVKIPFISYVYSLRLDKNDIKRILPKFVVRYLRKKIKGTNDGWTD